MDEVKFSSPEQVVAYVEEALKLPPIAAHEHLIEAKASVNTQVILRGDNPGYEYPMTPNLLLLREYAMSTLYWTGIEYGDFVDVFERQIPVVRALMRHQVPSDILALRSRELSQALTAELQRVPGYAEFEAYARRRWEELIATPKYFDPYRGNPGKW